MTNFIPIIPVEMVLYPGETLNLKVFEPAHVQLIKECLAENKTLGISLFIEGKIAEIGTLARVSELSKLYDDGVMDIKIMGIMPYKILEKLPNLPNKLYQGAIVTYPSFTKTGSAVVMQKVLRNLRTLHQHLGVTKDFGKPDEQLLSFDIAHVAGLSLLNEYRLLEFEQELHRQEFLNRHLAKFLTVIKKMDLIKEKIKLNGHFKNLKGFN